MIELQESQKAAFNEGAKELFEKHPKLIAIGLTGYTPYFNDGDPCHYSINTDYPSIQFEGDGDIRENYYDLEFNQNDKDQCLEIEAAGKDVLDFLNIFDDEDYLDMFDDHARIIITKDGIEVEEYNHD